MSTALCQSPECLLLVVRETAECLVLRARIQNVYCWLSDRVHNVYCFVSESRIFTAGCKRDCRMSGAKDQNPDCLLLAVRQSP